MVELLWIIRIRRDIMGYIIHYDITAIIIEAVIAFLFCMRRNYPTAANKVYIRMVVMATLSSAFDIISCYTISYFDSVPLWFNYFINISYLATYNLTAVIYLYYMYVVVMNGNVDMKRRALCVGLGAFEVFLLLPTAFTKFVIYFDENGNYCHGAGFYILYVIAIFILIAVLRLFLTYRSRLSKQQAYSITFFNVATLASVIVQFFYPEILISNFVIAIFLVLVYLSLQNPDDYLDKHSGCYNSDAFSKTIETQICANQKFAVVSFISEDFAYINQVLGMKIGDMLIDKIANRITKKYGFKNVYHISGCRFAIMSDINHYDEIVKDIRGFFSMPFSLGKVEVTLSVLICIVKYPDFIENADDVFDAVTYSFRELSEKGNKSVIFASAQSLKARRRESELIHLLKSAIREDGFEVYYQPIYSVKHKAFTTAEALIRLKSDKLGFVSPEEFIPLAERNGLIIEIGEIVLRKVCEYIKSGVPERLGIRYFEVNLSTIQCVQDNLAERLLSIMEEYRVSPKMFNFEITETAGSENDDALRKNMKKLIDCGASFSMDDYGTGFSTATYLISLPLRIIKIDKSILWSAMENYEAFIILRNTVQMLKELNKKIVVEGVENEKMRDTLIEMGCDFFQGYYYSKPVTEREFTRYIESYAE